MDITRPEFHKHFTLSFHAPQFDTQGRARLREGLDVLMSDDDALEAFRFANRAMATQRALTQRGALAASQECARRESERR